MAKFITLIKAHKIITFIAIVAVAGSSWYYYQARQNSAAQVDKYTLGQAQIGSVISFVSGTGQVLTSGQIDIKPKITANVVSVDAKEGQKVSSTTIIMHLDTKDVKDQLQQAKNSLDVARANLNLKLLGPTKEDLVVTENAVKSAKSAYEIAVNSLDGIKKNAAGDLKKAQSTLDNAQRQYDNALSSQGTDGTTSNQSLDNTYDSAKSTLGSVLITAKSSLISADNVLGISSPTNTSYKYLLGVLSLQTLNDANSTFYIAKESLTNFEALYKTTAVNWNQIDEDRLLVVANQTLQNFKTLQHNVYAMLVNTPVSTDLSQSILDGLRQSASSQESSAISAINSIQSAIQAIANAKNGIFTSGLSSSSSVDNAKNSLLNAQINLDQAVIDNKKTLDAAAADIVTKKMAWDNAQAQYDLKVAKPRPDDIISFRVQVSQAQTAYDTALENLREAQVTSPIDGILAKIDWNVGDVAMSGSPAATVVTTDRLAQVTLNEIDVAKIKIGQKATLTFSAIDGLSIAGKVVSIDTIGTVTQGVVNYNVKISFDNQDDRIRPQMSVSASIVVDEKLNILTVANSAIKTDNNGNSYVEVLTNPIKSTDPTDNSVTSNIPPVKKTVEVGSVNDTLTEITSGLSDGDQVITRTISASQTAPKTTSGLNLLGGSAGAGAGGGARRFGN